MSEARLIEAMQLVARAFHMIENEAPNGADAIGGVVCGALSVASNRFGVDKVRAKLRQVIDNEDFWKLLHRQHSSLIIRG